MNQPRRLVLLGATGTIGQQTLDLLGQSTSHFEVVGLSAHTQAEALAKIQVGVPQAKTWLTSLSAENKGLLDFLRSGDYDLCVHGMVGAAGLPFSAAILQAGKTLCLANKESLVLGGQWLSQLAKANSATIIPVDSEHAAIHQCLQGQAQNSVRRIYLTASGGALRDWPQEQLADATPKQVLEHPNWDMGPRITVDSATMMNKAFEIIEAHHLFDLEAHQIEVLLHRQSIIHSMVEFEDGNMLAQLGPPDMRFPIQYALHYPNRQACSLQGFDPKLFSTLTLEQVDESRYPAISLAKEALHAGSAAGTAINAADEIAVEAFLTGKISFAEIVPICQSTLRAMPAFEVNSMEEMTVVDGWAREYATAQLTSQAPA